MKVTLELTLDVKAGAWAGEYGTATDDHSIRNDVANHIENMVSSHLRSLDLIHSMSTVLT